jgi:pSer/pThr/pTyr-binding forkhead associated (FHA) protein
VHAGGTTSTPAAVISVTSAPAAPPRQAPSDGPIARLTYEDASGSHRFDVVADTVTIGRGGAAYKVDLRVAAAEDVSREHARIRRDRESGTFYLIDLSTLGTTLNGRHVPRGVLEADGVKRENGAESLLPDRARIGQAGTVFLDFERVSS